MFGNIPANTPATQQAIASPMQMNALPDACFFVKSTDRIISTAASATKTMASTFSNMVLAKNAQTTQTTVTTIIGMPSFSATPCARSSTAWSPALSIR